MIKYATAIRSQGTASTEAILRRFIRSASHPTYHAMLEVGRAQRTIFFVVRYLRGRELQREVTEGLDVVEGFNGANSVIYYGKGGEIASHRQDQQDCAVASDPASGTSVREHADAPRRPRRRRLGAASQPQNRRGLTLLFWQHVLPYGEVKLDMSARLNVRAAAPASAP